MAYVAVKGGEQAIGNAIELLKLSRCDGARSLETDVIVTRMKQLVDRVMCEAGFYAPAYAALALKQSEGSMEEAVFLMRAYRSTLSRPHTSLPIDCRDMRLTRRISSAFKDIPQGQILGPTYDYTHRLIDFHLQHETEEELTAFRKEHYTKTGGCTSAQGGDAGEAYTGAITNPETDAGGAAGVNASGPLMKAERVSAILKQEGVIRSYENDDRDPDDITQDKVMFPASRSARLQTLFRADTGFVSGVSYAGLRGYGFNAHPTIGELRSGYMEIEIAYPLDDRESMIVGEIPFTEVEGYFSDEISEGPEHSALGIAIGYGLAFGRAETKAIAMSILDSALDHPHPGSPPNDEEFVLLHGEALEMSGFISHLKLPHYVTYQSKLDNIRKTRQAGGWAEKARETATGKGAGFGHGQE
jgi:alpha-D-ribose 1-methylphosphonate 5-triphosphate synthase subunit PhnI